MTRVEEVNTAMMCMPEGWRYRWCGGGMCACMGAANCSGRLGQMGVSKQEWSEWVERNPDPTPKEDPNVARDRLIAALRIVAAEEKRVG